MRLGPFFYANGGRLLMKIEDVIDVISMNTVEPCNAITLARSIINDDEYLDLYLKSDDYKDFESKVLDKECALNDIYAQISRYGKRADSHWCRIMELFGEHGFKVRSKAGQFLIGNDKFRTFVSNEGTSLDGIYDVSHVAVFNVNDNDYQVVNRCIDEMMDSINSSVIGEFNIYDFVGGSIDASCVEPCRTIKDGWYHIYSYDGFVAFVEY